MGIVTKQKKPSRPVISFLHALVVFVVAFRKDMSYYTPDTMENNKYDDVPVPVPFTAVPRVP